MTSTEPMTYKPGPVILPGFYVRIRDRQPDRRESHVSHTDGLGDRDD